MSGVRCDFGPSSCTQRSQAAWSAAGMLEAERQFRRIIGYRDLAELALAVEREVVREPTITAPPNPAPEVAATPV